MKSKPYLGCKYTLQNYLIHRLLRAINAFGYLDPYAMDTSRQMMFQDARVNLSAYFQKIFSAEKELIDLHCKQQIFEIGSKSVNQSLIRGC